MGNNEYAHRIFTQKSEADKALNTLKGILAGIVIDDVVNESEINSLKEWVSQHNLLIQRNQFKEFMSAINGYLQNEIPKSEFIQDLIYLCQAYESDNYYYNGITSDIQILNGLCQGILADNRINDEEIEGLNQWINKHKHLDGLWPYDELTAIVEGVLADGEISSNDRELLHAFLLQFGSNGQSQSLNENLDDSISIYSANPKIEIQGKSFSFTGILESFSRSQAVETVEKFGGNSTPNPGQKTNYLVVGGSGNLSWAYTAYGRKIEIAIKLRKAGQRIQIVRESDFKKAVERAENKLFFDEVCKLTLQRDHLLDAAVNFFAGKEIYFQPSIKVNCPSATIIMGDLGAYSASINFTDANIIVLTNATIEASANQKYADEITELVSWYNSPGKPPIILSLESMIPYFKKRIINSSNLKLKKHIEDLSTEISALQLV